MREELYPSREMEISRDGGIGYRAFKCTWEERKRVAPRIGEPFPGETTLRCSWVKFKGLGRSTGTGLDHEYEMCRIECEYSTFQPVGGEPRFSMEFGGEVLETALGRTWAGTGTKVQQAQGTFYPEIVYVITLTLLQIPVTAMFNNVGKINWSYFLQAPPETLLFEGASVYSRYDYERELYIYQCTFRFLFRGCSHNLTWRAPKQARNADGTLRWSGATSEGDKGWYNEATWEPVYVLGPAGVGGWDKPLPPLYAYADFGPMMGMPSAPSRIIPFSTRDTGTVGPSDGLGGTKKALA